MGVDLTAIGSPRNSWSGSTATGEMGIPLILFIEQAMVGEMGMDQTTIGSP
jgi:hypothetical protein